MNEMCMYKKIHENIGKVPHAFILLICVINMKLIYEMCTQANSLKQW